MNNWGFNTKRRPDAPAEVAERLRWLSLNTRPLRDLTQPGVAREVLDAATSRLDGQRAAPVRERAVRTLIESRQDYPHEAAAIRSVAAKLGITSTESLRMGEAGRD